MLTSPIHKFQSIISENSKDNLKQKKRRKKRKKVPKITNLETNSLITPKTAANKKQQRKGLNKRKQYFQHDNRLRLKDKSRQIPFTSSEMFTNFNENNIEREIQYNEVAKKFKPIHNTSISLYKNSVIPKKAFFQNRSQKNLKRVKTQKLEQNFAFVGEERSCENNSITKPLTTLALMQPQICLCSCQTDQKKNTGNSYGKNNTIGLQTAVFGNVNSKLTSCTTSANLVKCSKNLASINNDFTKILELLQNQTPTLFIDHLFGNRKWLKNVDKPSRIGDSYNLSKAQQEKKAKLLKVLNIAECFAESCTLDSDHKPKEDIATSLALQKKVDTKREEAPSVAAKETPKHYAFVRTPSMEHDLPEDLGAVVADKTYIPLKKKKKKKIKERSPSPERKKDKKKKSKRSKRENKPKKSRKERKRKCSESETNADNDKESANEESESDNIETEEKKSRKKSKKEKKKRRNKRKEQYSSSDEAGSMSPSDKHVKNKKAETFNENTHNNYRSRSRSKENSTKLRESQRHRYESTYNHSRRSHSHRRKSRSYSRSNKSSSSRRDEIRDAQTVDLKYLNCRSYDRNGTTYNRKDREHEESRSLHKSKLENAEENIRNLKRKHIDKYLQKEEQSPSTDKRKRYSQSRSSTITGKSVEKTALAITSARNTYKRHSRTPNQTRSDSQSKLNKSRSRSPSTKTKCRNKSLSPPPRSSKIIEPTKFEKNIKKQKKYDITNQNDRAENNICRKTKPRSASLSSHTTSSTDTRISKSRTPSPKKGYLDKHSVSKNLHILKEQKVHSPSPIRSPTSQTERSRFTTDDKRRRDKKCSISSKEWIKSTKANIEEKSRTPPPKIDKKPLTPRSSRDSSELSYSPGRRNPERYRDILESTKNEKCKADENTEGKKDAEWDRREKAGKSERNQAKPVVRLQSQSDDESDATERNTEKMLDEFQELKRDKELNDLKMLEHLKTGLAAKAKEKIKTIEKMAASASTNSSTNNDGEVSDKSFKRIVRNSLNDFLTANNVTPAVVATCSPTTYNGTPNSPPGAIYPQTFEEVKKEQESVLQLTESFNSIENNEVTEKGNSTQIDCKKSLVTAHDNIPNLSSTGGPLRKIINATDKEKDRKREHDLYERERERESYSFYKDRYLERRQKSMHNFYSTCGGGIGGGTIGGGNISGGRRNSNNNMLNTNHRQRLNIMCNSSAVGGHHHPHSHLHSHHHHHLNHKIINNHHSSATPSFFLANNTSANPHTLLCNHANNSTNISFNRPSRINNTPLITATQFNNQMLSKQSNSILVNRRDHRTALSLGLSGTPCTNFSNSNLLLTKANTNPHHLHVAPVGHVVGGGHHHHHHHHHGQNTGVNGGGSNPTQITDRILMAASLVAAQRHSLGVRSSSVSSAAAVAAANNLNFLHQQNKPKLVIKPFKINDSQPLVAALADSSLVDAIVSKVSTATVAAAESAARRSRSRSRRSQSRKRYDEKSSVPSNSGGGERDGNRRRSLSRSRSSRSSTSSRSRSRSHSHRSSQSRTSASSSTSHTSSRSSSSSSCGTSRSGTRSPSIPRRRGSPSFLDRRRITSARKRPIPYHRKMSSDVSSCYCSSCCSRESSLHSRSPSQDSRSPSRCFEA